MKPRTAQWIVWFIVGIYFVLAGIGLYFLFLTNTPLANVSVPIILYILLFIVVGIWPVIGALIVTHHPKHPVGWLLTASFPLAAIDLFAVGYVGYATSLSPGLTSIPGAIFIWLNWSAQPFVLVGFTLLNLLFPTGRLLSRRWRIVAWASVIALPIYLLLQAFEPGPIAMFPSFDNPYAVTETVWRLLWPFFSITIAVLILCSLASVISLFLRLRSAQADERQQVKWLIFPAIIYWISQLLAFLVEADPSGIFLILGMALVLISVPVMVIAVAFAIFKYRLYDIDIIINRTLVYGALTAGVVGLYVVVVGTLGQVLQANNSLAGALLTTALVVMMFRPLHTRLQQGVDRLVPGKPTFLSFPASLKEQPPGRVFDEPPEPGQDKVRGGQVSEEIIRFPARMRYFIRTMWFFWAAIAWGIFLLALPTQITTASAEMSRSIAAPVASWVLYTLYTASLLTQVANSLVSLVLSGVLYLKRANEGVALFLSYFLLANAIVPIPLSFLEPIWPGASAYSYSVIQPLVYGPLLTAFLSVFPNGRFVPSWTRWLVGAAILYAPVGLFMFTSANYSKPTPPFIASVLFWFVLFFAGLYAQIYRYRYVSAPDERQQTKWVLYGFTMAFFLALLLTIWTISFQRQPQETLLPWWSPIINIGWNLAYAFVPISLTFAVMRYRLYEVDIIINRTLVYGALTVSVVSIYVLIVGGIGLLVQDEGNLFISLVATGLVAVLFQPLRERLHRAVNRLFYGQRDDPLIALSQLGKRLEAAIAPEVVLPTLVETISQTLKLPYVGISLKTGKEFKIAAQIGKREGDVIRYPLIYQGETVGQLIAGPRGYGESFSQADRRLLESIALQAGSAVYSVQITDALQRSRQQLVTTREEERRRLRRDLHDGLGATLAGLNLEAGVLRRSIRRDPEKAEAVVDEFRKDLRAAIDDIRHLVYELRPPTLDQLGLVEAVRNQASQCSWLEGQGGTVLQVKVETPEALPPLPAAVEVAAYRIVQEALTNVVNHAQAQRCVVRLELFADALKVEVVDDGVGLTNSRQQNHGLGLLSMRERAEELGGTCLIEPGSLSGTRIIASLPLLET